MAMTTPYAHTGADGALQGAHIALYPGSKPLVNVGDEGQIETMADHASERQAMRRRWGTAGDLAFGRRLGEETSGTMRFPLKAVSDTSPVVALVVTSGRR